MPGQWEPTTARHYVDLLQDILDKEDHINKGEEDGLDLSDFKEETIEAALRNKIYDSSMTIVMISKGMRNRTKPESDQWIPWEISYSLREQTRGGRTKTTNAMLGVVLPDENGSYDYYIVDQSCPACKCRTLRTDTLFGILSKNMFNVKEPSFKTCDRHSAGSRVYLGESSYIHSVKWADFQATPAHYIDKAYGIHGNLEGYNIVKTV